MATIHLKNITKSFNTGDGTQLHVLKDISFSVEAGSFVCLLGPSGSGKSVTLNLIGGLLKADSGELIIEEEGRKPRLGFVFQNHRLLPWALVKDNIDFVMAPSVKRQQRQKIIDSVLTMVGLREFKNYYPHQISGGMQQRVAIARAFSIQPDILLMDEPFSSLDEITARDMRAELIRLWTETRKTILFVTHDIAEACYLAQKIIIFTPKPTVICHEIPIPTPFPRRYGSDDLFEMEKIVMQAFEEGMSRSSW
ncbi:MAG: ABC transporter ATP-binding protein [Candidatus Tectomicrobia bacterium]|nr:ABC transporter ATP-binding protein [Candidatus Tectomicrobia bacterium]